MQIFIRTPVLFVNLVLLVTSVIFSASTGATWLSVTRLCHPAVYTRGIQDSGISEPSSRAMAVLLWGLMFPCNHGRCGSGQPHLLSSVPLLFPPLSLPYLELQVFLALQVSGWLGLSLSSAPEAWRSSGVFRAPQADFLFLQGGSRTPLIPRSL